jgi:hypothetical protein
VQEQSIRFTSSQRNELTKAGLLAAQINELENAALPVAQAYLSKPPALQDVRDELQKLLTTMQDARDVMSRLLSPKRAAATREVWNRVLLAEADMYNSFECIEKALSAVTLAHAVVQRAKSDLPMEQRRHRTADPFPVARINKALLDGFVKEHGAGKKGPPRPRVSASPTSAFQGIVGICYDAMGRNADPERAIKAYINQRRRRDQVTRDAVGIQSAPRMERASVRKRRSPGPKKM